MEGYNTLREYIDKHILWKSCNFYYNHISPTNSREDKVINITKLNLEEL